ncbi:MAG TPA: NF038122 family metalloprotease [Gemmataceae bacterium]|nr:NF038122 family metalloprotease [Gemmataceae bacterium]
MGPNSPRGMGREVVLGVSILLALAVAPPAHATLTITPTFDPSLGTPEQNAIKAAITDVTNNISSPNNITVAIYFASMNSGLGESNSTVFKISYFDYYNAFQAVATSPTQLTALSSLGAPPANSSSGNPNTGGTSVVITSAEGRNLGLNTPGLEGVNGHNYDSFIQLNTSITSPPNGLGGNYSLQAVATHEIDEALGIGGPGSSIGGTGFFANTVGDLDLYRFTAPNVYSYSTTQTTSPYSYFSIDKGATVLSYFNQTSGADYSDWLSNPRPGGFQPQVQDAFATPGASPTLGPSEITALEAIGYSQEQPSAAPEPASSLLAGLGFAVMGAYGWLRRKRPAA